MAKVRAYEIRNKKKADLLKQLDELKQELSTLRVAQVTNGAASKLGRIRLVRKNVARVLTVINQKSLDAMKTETAKNKRVPKQLRAKKTRALRRQLTPAQASNITLKAQKKAQNFAVRTFALKA